MTEMCGCKHPVSAHTADGKCTEWWRYPDVLEARQCGCIGVWEATTGGELREAIRNIVWEANSWNGAAIADAILALRALRDLLAERDKLAAQVQAAREVHPRHRIGDFDEPCAMCRALGGAS